MNRVILIGRATDDTKAGENYARYTLAVDRDYKKDGQPTADFINCVCFGKTAEFANNYIHKGTKIAIEGRIQTGSYEKDGHKVYTTDVVVDRHEFCEKADKSNKPAEATNAVTVEEVESIQEELPFK